MMGRRLITHIHNMPVQWTRYAVALLGGTALAAVTTAYAARGHASITFTMVPSAAAAACLSNAKAIVTVTSFGPVEELKIRAEGLPRKTDFDLFVIQVPNGPFGLSWYQGDLETNGDGRAEGRFIGRFNIETFIVAPGSTQAPVVHPSDAATNPATPPVHTYHLGLWFNSPADAAKAGCPATVTPFNGDHTAGIQALSTRNFGDLDGPLRHLVP